MRDLLDPSRPPFPPRENQKIIPPPKGCCLKAKKYNGREGVWKCAKCSVPVNVEAPEEMGWGGVKGHLTIWTLVTRVCEVNGNDSS